jgi:hypothetical protein
LLTSRTLANTLTVRSTKVIVLYLGYIKFAWSVPLKYSFSIWGWYSRICHIISLWKCY